MTDARQSAGPPLADTSDMPAVHRVFRDAVADAPALVGAAPAGDTARSGTVGSYYDNVLRFLEAHHEGEDLLVTPRLLERCRDDEAVVVRRIADQHHDVLTLMPDCNRAVAAWRASADPAAADDAVAAVRALGDLLVPHLDEEESEVLPLASTYLTAPEWGELPGHGMGAFGGDNLWLIVGLIREQFTDQQRQMMLAHMPPPVADAWRSSGEDEFRTFIAEVRAAP